MYRLLYDEDPPPPALPPPDATPDWRGSLDLPPAPPAAPPRPGPADLRPAGDGGSALLAAFLDGAALQDVTLPDAAAAMRAAGAAFRAFVRGVRRVLMARIEVKSAFRIDQTMLGARANPLKFAADDDDALAALLGAGRRREAAGAAAVNEALDDLRRHELAVMAALRSAIRELLARLEPARFRSGAEGAGVLPLQRRARAFELYEAEFRALADSLDDKFDDAFGRAFARAYEQVEAELQSREPQR
jgi:type VI secretion system protein ImpI/type VI secretion system protein